MKKQAGLLPAIVILISCILSLTVSAYDENVIRKEAGTVNLTVGSREDLTSWMLFDDEDLELEAVGAFTWKSRNTNIAAVDSNGVVTAQRAGVTTVTVTYSDNRSNTWIQSVRVKVSSGNSNEKAYSFTLDEGKIICLEGVLFPGLRSGGTIEWSCDKTQVASVDSEGYVTANRFGSCTITAVRTDSEGNSQSRKVAVQVVSIQVGHSFNTVTITLEPGDTVDMVELFYPHYTGSQTYGTIACTSSDSGVVSVESNRHITAEKAGTCTLTLAYTDIGDESDYAQKQPVTVKVVPGKS